ncbi:MAG TPA: hypothetical protein HA306_01055 [Methanosarcina sp.]|nr:hypothetical protein [Methanosarcina sp.]
MAPESNALAAQNGCFYARVPAVKLKLGKFTGVKAVCWKTVIRGAV